MVLGLATWLLGGLGCDGAPEPRGAASQPASHSLRPAVAEDPVRWIRMGNDHRQGWLLTPTRSQPVRLQVPGDAPSLRFSAGTWAPYESRHDCGPLALRVALDGETLLTRALPEDRGYSRAWLDHQLDLARWAGREVTLDFAVGAVAPAAGPTMNCFVAVGDVAVVAGDADAPRPPDLWFVLIDTLRRDHAGYEGAGLARTPHLDALAARGVRFREARSPSSYTVETMSAIFAGDNVMLDTPLRDVAVPPEDTRRWAPGVPERLADAGYRTLGLYDNLAVGPASGLGSGFQVYGRVGDAGMPRALTELLAAADPRQPRFVYLHLLGPHDPYCVHAGRTATWLEALGVPPPAEQCLSQAAIRASPVLDQTRKDQVRALYRGQVEETDAVLGELLALLEQQRGDREVWLVVTSDHGEEFWEHGDVGHATTLYEEVLEVPLVVEPPATSGLAVDRDVLAPVTTLDLAPTWLALAGLADTTGAAGRSLLPLLEGAEGPPERAVASTLFHYGPRDVVAWTRGETKVIQARPAPEVAAGSGLPLAVFELAADPGEQAGRAGTAVDARHHAAWVQLGVHGSAPLRVRLGSPAGEDVEVRVGTSAVTLATGESEATLVVTGLTERREALSVAFTPQGVSRELPTPWTAGWDLDPGPCRDEVCLSWGSPSSSWVHAAEVPATWREELEALGYVDPDSIPVPDRSR